MKKILTILTVLCFICSVSAQNKGLTAKEQVKSGVTNIVITEKTYQDLTNRTLNKRKLSKIADKKSGKPRLADDPYARRAYEVQRLKNPLTGKIPENIRELEKAYALSAKSGLVSKLKVGGLPFTHSGPKNVGGRTRALAVDIADASGNTILAGGTTGGMWKSTDRGQSWTRTTGLDQHPSVTAIAQDPRSGQTSTWYYTTGEYIGSAGETGAFYAGNGVYKSTDNGDSWFPLAATTSDTYSSFDNLFDICWNVCVDPTNGDVYVATYGAIKVSKDGGTTWSNDILSNNGKSNNYGAYTDVICTAGGVKYATVSTGGDQKWGIWRKGSEANAVWEEITPANFPTSYRRLVLAHAPSNTTQDIVYLLGQTPGEGQQDHSFWKLTYDTAAATPATWEDRSQNLPIGGSGDRDVNGFDSQGSYNLVIKVAPDDENMVFIGGTNLFRSDDAFATKATPLSDGVTNSSKTYWIGGYATENTVAQYDNHHPDNHALAFIDNNTLLSGHDGGISITNNCKQTADSKTGDDNKPVDWTFLNNSYLTTQAYTVAIDQDNLANKFLLSGFQDNGSWLGRDALATTDWNYWGSGDGSYAAIIAQGKHFLSSSQNGTVYLENDPNGPDDYYYTRVDPDGADGQLFINPFIVDANSNEIMFYAAGSYVWRNSDIFGIPQFSTNAATANWEKMDVSKASGTVTYLESSTYPAHVLYYGTSAGKIYKMENSHSDKAKVTDITGTNMPANAYVSSIDVNPLNANEVMVSFSNYKVESIYYSKDGGANWTAVSGNLEDGSDTGNGPSVRSVAIMVSPTDTTYYAGTSTGLYSTSTLNGSNTVWTSEAADKIGTTVVDMIKVRRDGFIAAATHGNGIFTADADYSASAPRALIGMTKDTLQIGDAVDFINQSIGDGISSYQWTFTGAETASSTDPNPSGIVYKTPGTYDVSLTVSNATGSNTQTITSAIVVKSVEAKFSASATSVNVGDVVQFTNLSGSVPTSFNWSFPGGSPSSSTDKDVAVTYNTVGTYDVSLTVSDGTFSDTQTKKAYITVLDPDDDNDAWLYNVDPANESQLTQFGFTGDNDGYVTGHTNLLIDQYAEKFTITNPNLNSVKQVAILPTVLQSNSTDPSITIKIWNGTTEPSQEVYSQVVPYSQLTEDQFNTIDLDFSVAVNKDFFVGYEINYTNPVDSFAVAHLPLDATAGWDNTAYMHFNDSSPSNIDPGWYGYSNIFDGNPNTSLAIKALVGFDAGATGIDDGLSSRKVKKLLIYPNPMTDQTKVEFPNEQNQKYRLVVIDASGRVVRIIENITNNNVIINREQLKPGIHIINLSGEKIYKGKLLVK